MDIVIPVRPGPQNDELRFALRSIAANLPHDRVFIIGGAPSWLNTKAVEYVRKPKRNTKYETTSAHIRYACTIRDLSEPWLLMNDDMFIVKPIDAVPILHRGPIAEVLAEYRAKRMRTSRYMQGMARTKMLLERNGYRRPLSYELHVPLPVQREPMIAALAMAKRSRIQVPHKRSIYGAVAELGGRRSRDVKVIRKGQPLPAGPFWSSSDQSFQVTVAPALRRMFPDRCAYER